MEFLIIIIIITIIITYCIPGLLCLALREKETERFPFNPHNHYSHCIESETEVQRG